MPVLGRANVFVSHSWLCKYSTLADIIDQHEVLTRRSETYWVDIFAINQHAGNVERELQHLGETIVDCGAVLVAAYPWTSPLVLSRVWCLYEVHKACTNNVPIEMLVSGSDMQDMLGTIDNDNAAMRKVLSASSNEHLDARRCQATVPEDKSMILKQISGSVGFESFNKTVLETMRASYTQVAMRRTLYCVTGSTTACGKKARRALWEAPKVDLEDLDRAMEEGRAEEVKLASI